LSAGVMASLDEEITALKTEIEGYKLDLKEATSREEKSELRGLIKSRSDYLVGLQKQMNTAYLSETCWPSSQSSRVVSTVQFKEHGIPTHATQIEDPQGDALGAEMIISKTSWPSFIDATQILLVRASQIRFYDQFVHPQILRNIILVGSPGIGKSSVGMYAIYRGLKAGRVVIWHSPNAENICRVYDGNIVQSLKMSHERVMALIDDANTLSIYDGVTPELAGCACQRLLITSPRRDVWYPYHKLNSTLKYLGPPTEQEALLYWRVCFPELTKDEVLNSIALFGPNLRACFTKYLNWDREYLLRLIASLSLDELENVVRLKESGKDNPCHGIFAIVATDDFDDGGRKFVSSFVANEVVTKMLARHHEAFMNWIAMAAAQPSSASFHSIFSDVFERVSIELFAAGGKFETQDLRTGKYSMLDFPKQIIQEFEKMSEVKQLENVVQVPLNKKFPICDALSYDSKILRTFNSTINVSHDVLMLSVNQKQGLYMLEKNLPSMTHEHFFLVPLERFRRFDVLADSKFKWNLPSEKVTKVGLPLSRKEQKLAQGKWSFRSIAISVTGSKKPFSTLRGILTLCRR